MQPSPTLLHQNRQLHKQSLDAAMRLISVLCVMAGSCHLLHVSTHHANMLWLCYADRVR